MVRAWTERPAASDSIGSIPIGAGPPPTKSRSCPTHAPSPCGRWPTWPRSDPAARPFLAALALVPPIFRAVKRERDFVVQSLVRRAAGGIVPRREGVLRIEAAALSLCSSAGVARVAGESDWDPCEPLRALGAWAMVMATFDRGLGLFDRPSRVARGGHAALRWPASGAPRSRRASTWYSRPPSAVALAGLASWRARGRAGGRAALYLGIAAAALTKGA